MTSIVLVHGAWGGSYGFRLVRPLLAAAGHNVLTPSLTGIGERSHLTGDHVTLDLHVKDLTNTVFYEDLHDIVLLGFSYGGMVVTAALDELGDKVKHLVYLDAFVPKHGDTAFSIIGATGEAHMTEHADNGLIPPIPRELATPEETAWSNARRALQPIGTFNTPVSLTTPVDDHPFSRTYIKATADPNEPADSPFWNFAQHAQTSPAWDYHEIATNHMVPMTKPHDLATILLDIANRPA